MKKLMLALLSGGISSEREVSLNSGDQVYDALDKEKYDIIRYDPKTDLQQLVADAAKIDAALIIHNSQGAPWERKAKGFSVLAVERGGTKFNATSVQPGSFFFSTEAGAIFMLLRDDALGTRQLLRVSLDSLLVEPIDLERRPRGLTVISSLDRLLVDYEHPDGHIELFDWTGAITNSFAGFQIVDRIKE